MSLSVIEKRPQRGHAGCSGIFFRLLDWNSKLAKTKIFSKKLLLPARSAKRSAGKFAGNEMHRAKLLLIADENRGGFPNSKKSNADGNPAIGMRAAGIVARLMGLDSIPVSDHEKHRKALDSHGWEKIEEYYRLDQNLCNEVSDLEKTGEFLDRRRANDAILTASGKQYHYTDSPEKSPRVLSSVKQYHYTDSPEKSPRVFSSVKQYHYTDSHEKSPRVFSSVNEARLIQTATKILAPGLKSGSQIRLAITSNGDLRSENTGFESEVALKRSNELQTDSLVGPYRNCGGTVELPLPKRGVKEPLVAGSTSDSSIKDLKIPHGKDVDLMKRKHHMTINQNKCKLSVEMGSKCALKGKSLKTAELDDSVHGKKMVNPRGKISIDANGKKSSNSSPRWNSDSKVPSKCGKGSPNVRNAWEKSAEHRRKANINLKKANNAAETNHSLIKQQSTQNDKINGNKLGLSYKNCVKNETLSSRDTGIVFNGNKSGLSYKNCVKNETLSSRDTGIVSFTFSSPLKHTFPSSQRLIKGKSEGKMERKGDIFSRKSAPLNADKNASPSRSDSSCCLRGDDLNNLSEEKINELNSLCQSESKDQITNNDADFDASTPKNNCFTEFSMFSENGDKKFDIHQEFQEGANPFNASSVINGCNLPSPISIFDASFSSDSCSVLSFNGGLVMKESKTGIDFTNKCDKTEPLILDFELLDSAASIEKIQNGGGAETGLSDEAVLKTKLLLEIILSFDPNINALWHSANSFLFDIFTSISDTFFKKTNPSLAIFEANVENHLKSFLFDFLIESLESRFDCLCLPGYKILPNKDEILKEVYSEIGRSQEGKVSSDFAEVELTSSATRWPESMVEASLIGVEIGSALLGKLVDEMVIDLFKK